MDVFATVLDYLVASYVDIGDGQSLRRYIDNKSYNQLYDEGTAVTELEKDKKMDSAEIPNLMIRHKSYKVSVG